MDILQMAEQASQEAMKEAQEEPDNAQGRLQEVETGTAEGEAEGEAVQTQEKGTEEEGRVLPGSEEGAGEEPGVPDEITEQQAQETIARKSGWRPREEWNGKGEWVDAAEYNRRGPLFEHITKLKQEIRQYQGTVDNLVAHNRKMEERTREKVLAELEEDKLKAVQDGDVEEYQRIETEIRDTQKEAEPEPESKDDPKLDPAITEWINKNPWYDSDPARRSYMISVQTENLAKGHSISEALKISEQAVRQEFSHKFDNPNKNRPSPSMGNNRTEQAKAYSISDLPPDYRPVFQAIARKTDMSLTEYVNQLKELGAM